MRNDDGENTVEVRIEDGKVTAKVNGEKVPEDRVVREGDEIRVQDAKGKVLATFHVSADQPRPPKGARAPKPPKPPTSNRTPVPDQGWTPPKVMIGITMGEPSEDLRTEHDLKEGEAILIQRVIDGLPGDKAGLKENDIITEIDGQKPVNQEKLREILKGKDAGDTVTFTVLRKGGDKTIRVTLDKYDQEKMAKATGGFPGEMNLGEGDHGMTFQVPGGGQWQTFRIPDNNGRAYLLGNQGNLDERMGELDRKIAQLDEKIARLNDQIAKLQELTEKLAKQRQDR
jgi:hypothetical protein